MKRFQLYALAAVLACSSSGSGTSTAPRPDRNVITATELMSVPSSSLYDVIEKLRPQFLRSRGPTSINLPSEEYPAVYVDERPYGDIGSLRTLVTGQIGEVHYYDPMSAQQKFGLTSGSGVISVYIKR